MSEALKQRLAAIGVKIEQRAAIDLPHGERFYDCPECLDMGIVYVAVAHERTSYCGLEVRPCFRCSRGTRKHGTPGGKCTWADKAERHCPHCGASPGDMIPPGWTYSGPAGMSYADAAEWRHVQAKQRSKILD